MLGNGSYHAPRGGAVPTNTRDFGYPKALLQLNIEYEDGTRASVVSDESWRRSTAGPIRANNEYDGEEYDARPGAAADWQSACGVWRHSCGHGSR
jgi:alpha-L-rhamnosidase